ncbi:30S ribosomal protein S17 [Candidatus Dojkabacteria bacterium]|nr:30S ribosomal protein S17 [Candidatus Dojkabacteria bacterium]
MTGTVVGNKMQKTVKVEVTRLVRHPRYKKVMKETKIYFAHTEKDHKIGSEVTIEECRPISKNVKCRVVEGK